MQEKFESKEGENVAAIQQEIRGHKAVDHKNKRRRVSSPRVTEILILQMMSPKAEKRKGAVDQNKKSATRPHRKADAPPQSMAEN